MLVACVGPVGDSRSSYTGFSRVDKGASVACCGVA